MRASANIGLLSSGNIPWLYKNGNEFTPITGGWMSEGWSGSSLWVNNAPTLTKNSTYMTAAMPNTYQTGQSGVFRTSNKINLTGKSSIKLTCSYLLGAIATPLDVGKYNRLYVFVSNTSSGYWASDLAVCDAINLFAENTGNIDVSASTHDVYLDISGLSGDYYVCIGCAWRYQAHASWVRVDDVIKVA